MTCRNLGRVQKLEEPRNPVTRHELLTSALKSEEINDLSESGHVHQLEESGIHELLNLLVTYHLLAF